VSSSKRQATTQNYHNILSGPIKEPIIILNASLLRILWKKNLPFSCTRRRTLCSWKFVTYNIRNMLVLSPHGHMKLWWSFKEGLLFYWGIWDLCNAYYWRQQTLSEFWSYNSPSRTWCLLKPRSHHRKKKWMNPSLTRYLSTNVNFL
jgi:hypothetical protein